MKYFVSLLLSGALLLAGCCNRECDPPVFNINLTYTGFAPGAADTLKVYHYGDSGFTQAIDSNIFAGVSEDSVQAYALTPMQNRSYILSLVPDGRRDTINSVDFIESYCKSCFKKNTYFVPQGFTLNGKAVEGLDAEIKK